MGLNRLALKAFVYNNESLVLKRGRSPHQIWLLFGKNHHFSSLQKNIHLGSGQSPVQSPLASQTSKPAQDHLRESHPPRPDKHPKGGHKIQKARAEGTPLGIQDPPILQKQVEPRHKSPRSAYNPQEKLNRPSAETETPKDPLLLIMFSHLPTHK